MDKNITTRFFALAHSDDTNTTFSTALKKAWNIENVAERERNIGENCCVRLEDFLERDDGLIVADLTRVQTENLPSSVTEVGTDKLAEDKIGHGVAFVLDEKNQILATQFDIRAVSPGRICQYVNKFVQRGTYSVYPILRSDAWSSFEVQTPISFCLTAAGLKGFDATALPEASDFEVNIDSMIRMHGASKIKIDISLRRDEQNEISTSSIRSTVLRLMRFRSNDQMRIQKLEAKTLESDTPLDFLKFIFAISRVIDLERNNPDSNRDKRAEFVLSCFTQNRDYLIEASRT